MGAHTAAVTGDQHQTEQSNKSPVIRFRDYSRLAGPACQCHLLKTILLFRVVCECVAVMVRMYFPRTGSACVYLPEAPPETLPELICASSSQWVRLYNYCLLFLIFYFFGAGEMAQSLKKLGSQPKRLHLFYVYGVLPACVCV